MNLIQQVYQLNVVNCIAKRKNKTNIYIFRFQEKIGGYLGYPYWCFNEEIVPLPKKEEKEDSTN